MHPLKIVHSQWNAKNSKNAWKTCQSAISMYLHKFHFNNSQISYSSFKKNVWNVKNVLAYWFSVKFLLLRKTLIFFDPIFSDWINKLLQLWLTSLRHFIHIVCNKNSYRYNNSRLIMNRPVEWMEFQQFTWIDSVLVSCNFYVYCICKQLLVAFEEISKRLGWNFKYIYTHRIFHQKIFPFFSSNQDSKKNCSHKSFGIFPHLLLR